MTTRGLLLIPLLLAATAVMAQSPDVAPATLKPTRLVDVVTAAGTLIAAAVAIGRVIVIRRRRSRLAGQNVTKQDSTSSHS